MLTDIKYLVELGISPLLLLLSEHSHSHDEAVRLTWGLRSPYHGNAMVTDGHSKEYHWARGGPISVLRSDISMLGCPAVPLTH